MNTKQLDNYIRATIPEPWTILGIKLRPFSLGHVLLMKRFGCAYGSEDPETKGGILDLLFAIAICSRTYDDFLEWMDDEKSFYKWLQKWFKQIEHAVDNDKTFNLVQKFFMFKHYMEDGMVKPLYFKTDDKDEHKDTGSHWIQHVITSLTSEGSRYTEKQLLDMPLAKVMNDYFLLAESKGIIDLMTDDEIEQVEALNQTEVTT